MIPKRIFFFWGNEQMSWCRYMTLHSFRKLHPDWEMVLYTGKQEVKEKQWRQHNEQDFFVWTGKDYFPEVHKLDVDVREWRLQDNSICPEFADEGAISPSHKSNFLKWCKLYEEGGIYSDLDIIYLKSIEPYYLKLNANGVSGCLCAHDGTLAIGWMASQPGCQLFKDVFQSATETYRSTLYQSAGVWSVYELFGAEVKRRKAELPIQTIQNRYPAETIEDLPVDYFYYFRYPRMEEIWTQDISPQSLPESCLGIHWYAGHPLAQKWNQLLHGKNFRRVKQQNAFTRAAALVEDLS